MDTQQLLDALTDHISLYHRRKEKCDSGRNIEAEKIKLWMEGLNVKQRQAALTVVDSSWVAIVLKMQERLEKDGPGFFFLLPDLPVPADNGGQNVGQCLNEKRKLKQKNGRKGRSKVAESASQHAKHSDEKWDEKTYMNMKGSNDKESGLHFGLSLPSLCFRKAQGLLRRLTGTQMAEDLLLDNIQLFSSQDGDKGICPKLDTLILNEKLLENLNEFCSTMDIIASNAFLKEQAPSSFSSWEETPWLKDRGYYSLAAFVANKLEFTIWSAWIHFIGAKRPPKTISKLCFQIASEKASTALRICNRRQELRENWGKLDLRTKQKVLQYAVSKVAKSEALKVIQETKSSLNSASTPNGKLQASPAAPYIRATELILESFEMKSMLFSLQMDYLFCSPLQPVFASASVMLLLERVRSGIIAAINGFAEADLLTSDSIRNEMTGQTVRGKTRRRKCKKQSGNVDMKNAVPSYPPEDRPLTKACKSQDGNGSQKPHKDMGKQAKSNQSIRCNGATAKSQMPQPESVMKLNGHDGYDAETGVEDKNNELVGKIVTQSDLIAEASKRESIGVSETTDVSTQELYTGINTHDDRSSPLPTCSVGYITVHDDVENQSEFGESGRICPSIENNQNGFDGKTKARTTKLSSKHVTSSKKDILPHCSSTSVDLGPNFSHISSIEPSSNTSLTSSLSMNLNPSSNPVRSQTASVNCDAYANHKNGMDKLLTDGSMPPPASIINSGPALLPSLKNRGVGACRTSAVPLCISHEWPRPPQTRFCGSSDHIQPATADRLHLDVSKTWAKHQKASWISRSNSVAVRRQTTHGETIPQRNTINTTLRSWDWPPLFRPSVTTHFSLPSINHTPLQSAFPGYSLEASSKAFDELDGFDRTMDDSEFDNSSCMLDEMDDAEGFFISEEVESSVDDTDILYNTDYNQIFGGGVMYWTSADYTGMGYSRPGSLSSEDSAWARHEADLSTVLDDIVGISTFNSAASSLGSSSSSPSVSHQWRSLQQVGSEYGPKFAFAAANHMEELDIGRPIVSSVRGVHGEIPSLDSSNQVLPPIIVTRASKAELNKLHEARSPHMPRGRRDMFKWKRSPSPVLRCVPPAPPPPPPSPIAGIRKCRGLSIARSGSSSPRHWGLCCRTNSEEKQMQEDYLKSGTDAILKNGWRSCITSTRPMYPLSGALLCERLIAIPPLALEQDHPDAAFPMQTTTLLQNNPAMHQAINVLHATLHKEIEAFCFQVARENLARKSYIDSAVRKVTHALQVLWPRSRTNIFGSNATGLALPNSDVDLVVCLPPVRNLEPIKEAGILEGRNGIKETCLQHAARYLADQDWVKSDSLKTIENTAIPIIMLVAEVVPSHDDGNIMLEASREETHALNIIQQEHCDKKLNPWSCEDRKFVRLDISFEAPSHTGLHTAELVRKLLARFPAITPLALVLKQFLMDRSLDQPYTGGLSSYCLVLLITRFLQHQNHIGLSSQHQNLGSLLMDFLHFFGCVFDTRRMCVCIRGDGLYVNRARTHSIDPLHIEDPLHPVNNVGRNCFRILQCTKAFADAYATLERVLHSMSSTPLDKSGDWKLLQKILPSISGVD